MWAWQGLNLRPLRCQRTARPASAYNGQRKSANSAPAYLAPVAPDTAISRPYFTLNLECCYCTVVTDNEKPTMLCSSSMRAKLLAECRSA